MVHGLAALRSVVHHHPEPFVEPLVLMGEVGVDWLIWFVLKNNSWLSISQWFCCWNSPEPPSKLSQRSCNFGCCAYTDH